VKSRIQPLRVGDPKNFQGWTINGLIGEGGQSTIYLAEKNGSKAALKIIRKEHLHNEKSVNRFFTEIRNLEILDNPNIARVIEVEDSGFFVAMEFIDGPNLEDYVEESGPLEIGEWAHYAQSLAKTIEYCHSKGIIHKDISPRNIVVGPDGPVLIDFGISYLEKDPRLTSIEETIGTPPFMSPEHFGMTRPKEMDNFSLAGTLIFAATGHYPFSGDNTAAWKESILFSQPDFSGLSEDQVMVLSPLLYKKAEERGSLANFSKIVRELASTEPLSDFVAKEFAKVKRESEKKLIQEKKLLTVKRQTIKKNVAGAAIVSLLSIGLVASGIFAIQSNSRDSATNFATPIEEAKPSSKPTGIASQSLEPIEEDSILGAPATKDKSIINKEIQANLDLSKKYFESNQLNKALEYAKLAANSGNALGMYRVAYILVAQDKRQEAIVWYEKSANLGYGDAFWNLGALYEKLGKTELALSWYEKGAKIKSVGSLNALGFYYGNKKKDALKAIPYYQKSADLGSIMGMTNLGLVYEVIGDKVSAKKWHTKASDLGSVDASINLGLFYEDAADWTNARKYYKRAADKKDPTGMYNLAMVLANNFGQSDVSCSLLKEAVLIDSIESNTRKLATAAINKGCVSASVSPGSSPKPIASSDSLKVSAPVASNVQVDGIFGRAFKNELNYWVIPLTVIKGAKVPELTAIQFRLIGYPDADWLGIPYKLKTASIDGTIYAEVDDFLFAFIFKDQKYCPEFRIVREESGKIVRIWNKGQPDCATDYNP
jgi:serine/threonine protein kinase